MGQQIVAKASRIRIICSVACLLCIGIVSAQTQRVTESGAECSFPQPYNGTIYSDCFEVDGSEVCEINGELENCIPISETSTPSETSVLIPSSTTPTPTPTPIRPSPLTPTPEPVFTETGELCQFPFTFAPYEYYQCIHVGGQQQCKVEGGDMQNCVFPDTDNSTEIVDRTTTDGRECSIPFDYYGVTYNNCAVISGNEFCLLNNTWVDCAPISEESSSPDQSDTVIITIPSPTPTPTITLTIPNSPSPTVSRTTVDGRECDLPFIYGGQMWDDCTTDSSGREVCMIDSQYVQCEPIQGATPETPVTPVPTPSATPIIPIPSPTPRSSPVIVIPTPTPSPTPVRLPPSPSPIIPRVTVTGEQCEFPFKFGPYEYSQCIFDNNTFSCMVNDEMVECAPLTEDSLSSVIQTPVLIPMAPLIENNMASPSSSTPSIQTLFPQAQSPYNETRQTIDGQICDFPIEFNGGMYYDCVKFGEKEQCRVGDQWMECKPVPTPTPTPTSTPLLQRTTVQGETCKFPFIHRGVIHTDCFLIDSKEYCGTESSQVGDDSTLQECNPLPQQFETPASKNIRYTFDGQICTFPSQFQGVVYTDCFEVQNQLYCEADGVLNPCDMNNTYQGDNSEASTPGGIPVRFTTDGDQCTFPIMHQGQQYYDCFTVNNTLSCVVNNQIKQCMIDIILPKVEPPTPPPILESELILESFVPKAAERKIALNGEQCDYPFEYNNEPQYACIEKDGIQQCMVNGNWAECDSQLQQQQQQDSGKNDGLSSSAIGGIVFAVLFVTVVVIAVVLVVLFFYRKAVFKGRYQDMESKGGAGGVPANGGAPVQVMEGPPKNGGVNLSKVSARPNKKSLDQTSVELTAY